MAWGERSLSAPLARWGLGLGGSGAALELVLEDEQVVGRRDRDDAFVRMPGGVQYFLIEVEAVHAYFVLKQIFRYCSKEMY